MAKAVDPWEIPSGSLDYLWQNPVFSQWEHRMHILDYRYVDVANRGLPL